MKKTNYWSLLAIMMVAMLSIGFTSCGDDDEEVTPSEQQKPQDETPKPDRYKSMVTKEWYWITENKDPIDLHYMEITTSGYYYIYNYHLGASDNFKTVYKDTVIVLYPGEVGETEMNTTLIPDFTGMSIIECRRMAKEYGLNIVVDGNIKGRVVEQDPPSSIRSAKDPTLTPTPTPDPDAPPPDETGEDPGEDPGEETTGEPPETTAPEGYTITADTKFSIDENR